MKTALELASSIYDSPETHKRRALALRRLAGGVRTEAERKGYTGLSDKEVRALQEAVGILEKLAGAYQKAKPVAQVRRDNGAAEERAVRAAMQENFVKLTSIADKVALVAAVRSYLLRQGRVETLEDLRYAFDEAIDGLVYQLALPATKRKAQEVVAEAWAKFEEKRIELADTHATIVGRLAIAAERAQ